MNRARVEIDHRFPSIRVTGAAAVYDLDDGTRHVDFIEIAWNGQPIEDLEGFTPKVRHQIRDLFIEQAEKEERPNADPS